MATLGLAACRSDSAPGSGAVNAVVSGNAGGQQGIDPALLRQPITCPRVRIQPDTEVVRREVGDGGTPESLRWQATILKVARECTERGEGVAMRVGVSGRVIEGASGAPPSVELPLRVAVREGEEVTYSRLHSVTVTIDAASQSWAFVDDAVVVADPDSAQIVVGFDG